MSVKRFSSYPHELTEDPTRCISRRPDQTKEALAPVFPIFRLERSDSDRFCIDEGGEEREMTVSDE